MRISVQRFIVAAFVGAAFSAVCFLLLASPQAWLAHALAPAAEILMLPSALLYVVMGRSLHDSFLIGVAIRSFIFYSFFAYCALGMLAARKSAKPR